MSKVRKSGLPVIVYSLLLVAIWVASWISGIVGLLSSGVQRNESLLSASGIRWALRTAVDSLESAPWGGAVLCVVALGLLYGSGLSETLFLLLTGKALSHNRRSAVMMSLALLLLWIAIIVLCSVAPWHMLSGVTPGFFSSPLAVGLFPLIFIVVLSIAVMHGAVSGCYRSFQDVWEGVGDVSALFLPAFIAMIPASGVMPCLSFVGVPLSSGALSGVLELLLYLLPFLVALLSNMALFKGDSFRKE